MRYAIYYCPAEDSELGRFGDSWLTGAAEAVPAISPRRMDELLSDVRRYGWHATMRAPFALSAGVVYADLRAAVFNIASTMNAFALPLQLDRLAGFLALRPHSDSAAVDALAAACLHALESLCAPLPDGALQRRAKGLDAAELTLLHRYGYPYVLDRYRFHMTLSAPATAAEERSMRDWLAPLVAKLGPAKMDALAICQEAAPGAPFTVVERISLRTEPVA
ncbi:DUF1045 domain-containing protein [Dyella subtropica]|uniref:DUF1045 domain-containing protein n=1 Tax=Dyella subtropica TaxID=2992127 RepID=UPI00225AB0AB|nr:DUF1045 domain-containing protein [Dyella subtropica]